jgi:hypothetical protein
VARRLWNASLPRSQPGLVMCSWWRMVSYRSLNMCSLRNQGTTLVEGML